MRVTTGSGTLKFSPLLPASLVYTVLALNPFSAASDQHYLLLVSLSAG